MKSSLCVCRPAMPPTDAPAPVVVSPGFLVASFATVPDPRRRQGTRYPLAALLVLSVVAILSNCTSVLAIAQFGADAPLPCGKPWACPWGRFPASPHCSVSLPS